MLIVQKRKEDKAGERYSAMVGTWILVSQRLYSQVPTYSVLALAN